MSALQNVSPTPLFQRKTVRTGIRYTGMIFFAFVLFGVILLLSGKDPIQSYKDIFSSTLGSSYGFSEVLVGMIPVLITALAVALPSRAGLINVGGEGQLYIGAAFATFAALTFQDLSPWVLLPLMVLLSMIGGALWAFIPGYLKAIGLVNETITTLLLNSVAPKVIGFLIFGFWHSAMDTVKTPNFVDAARLPTFFGTRIHLGMVFALVLLVAFWAVMKYTRWGLEIRSIGGNAQAARRNGLPVKRIPDRHHVYRRRNCRVGRYGAGFRFLRRSPAQFFLEPWFHGISDLLACRRGTAWNFPDVVCGFPDLYRRQSPATHP